MQDTPYRVSLDQLHRDAVRILPGDRSGLHLSPKQNKLARRRSALEDFNSLLRSHAHLGWGSLAACLGRKKHWKSKRRKQT